MSGGYGIPERIVRIGIALAVVFLILGGLVLLLASQESRYLTDSRNLGRLVEQALIYATLAAGMSLVLVAGEADFSTGGVVSLAMVVTVELMVSNNVPAVAALAVALILGTLVGLTNGVLIVLLRLPFYLVTPAMWLLVIQLGVILFGSSFRTLPRGEPFAGSLLLLIVLNVVVCGLGVLALFLLGYFTSLGKLYSLNARSDAEGRPGGLALGLYKIGAYTVSGLLAAVAGVALLNLYRIAGSGVHGDLSIMAIAAVVVGGVPLWKGSSRLLGAFLGGFALALANYTIVAMQIRGKGVDFPNSLAWAVLALLVAILWGVAGWVLDLVFGRRKGTQVGDTAQHVTGGNR